MRRLTEQGARPVRIVADLYLGGVRCKSRWCTDCGHSAIGRARQGVTSNRVASLSNLSALVPFANSVDCCVSYVAATLLCLSSVDCKPCACARAHRLRSQLT